MREIKSKKKTEKKNGWKLKLKNKNLNQLKPVLFAVSSSCMSLHPFLQVSFYINYYIRCTVVDILVP